MDPETAIQEVQNESAHEGAAEVAAVISDQVAGVEETLEEHAALSEERHDEILEDTSWLRNGINEICQSQTTMANQLTSVQTEVSNLSERIRTMEENNQNQPVAAVAVAVPVSSGTESESPVTNQSTPEISETPVTPQAPPESTPQSAGVENPEAKTQRKRFRII
jgi:hypothetical protein